MAARFNLLLFVAVIASGLYLVHVSSRARNLFVDLEKAQNEERTLETQYEQLQVEKRALGVRVPIRTGHVRVARPRKIAGGLESARDEVPDHLVELGGADGETLHPEGAVAVARQHLHLAVKRVGTDDVGPPVAVDVCHRQGGRKLPGGDGLKPSGRVVKTGGIVSDGPYAEAKEVIASFGIIQAENYDAAVEIAKECPGQYTGKNCHAIEIREMGGYA